INDASTIGVVVPQRAEISTAPAGGYNTAPYPYGQCTWWSAYNRAIYPGNKMGNGGEWYGTAEATGHAVSERPTVGAWAVWSTALPGSGGAGHVAIVIAVSQNGQQFEVSEMNELGNGVIDQRIDSVSDPYLTGFVPE
ncbi:MAG: CHAP domain-containing protein, partial [Candidatus Dormibacteraceae bacterium]